MAFEPGHPKIGGRQKGSVNKDTRTVRDIVEGILGRSIPEELIALAGADKNARRQVLTDLTPYCYRKLAPKEDAETLEARAKSDSTLVANAISLLQTKVRENPDDTSG